VIELSKLSKQQTAAAVVAILLCMIFQVAFSIRQQSSTWDECDHLFAGYMSLKAHDFALNPEHPPLAKMVAALPLLPLRLRVAPPQGRYFKDEAYFRGRELVYRNGPANGGSYTADTLFFRARMAIFVFTILLGIALFLALSEMDSSLTGLIALLLLAFEPSILTNAAIITTDAAVTSTLFIAVYALYRYRRSPSKLRLIVAGLCSGAALAAKHSAILLLPILFALLAGEVAAAWWRNRRRTEGTNTVGRFALQAGGAFIVIAVIAVGTLWAVYGFRYRMVPSGPSTIPSLASTMVSLPSHDVWVLTTISRLHLLPESYIFGIVDVRRVAGNQPTYLFGHILANGVPYYFPIVLVIKLTLPALLLLAVFAWGVLSGRIRRTRELWYLIAPPLLFLGFSLTSPLNVGIRHVLPIVPFLLALAAIGAVTLIKRGRGFAYAVAGLLLWNVVSCLHAFPNYMPYSNELWGGPSQTHRYLSDAAVEWGQNLKWTKTYLDQHNIHDCYFAYFVEPYILPSDYGIPCKLLPTLESRGQVEIDVPDVIHGTVLISDSVLSGYELGSRLRNPYDSLFHRKPDDVIMNGVEVYHGDFHLPLASSMMYEIRARKLLTKDPAAALIPAQRAVQIAPDGVDANVILGNVLLALGRKHDAAAQYQKALAISDGMEPSARLSSRDRINRLLAKCN